jgi:hypothetical protein
VLKILGEKSFSLLISPSYVKFETGLMSSESQDKVLAESGFRDIIPQGSAEATSKIKH